MVINTQGATLKLNFSILLLFYCYCYSSAAASEKKTARIARVVVVEKASVIKPNRRMLRLALGCTSNCQLPDSLPVEVEAVAIKADLSTITTIVAKGAG